MRIVSSQAVSFKEAVFKSQRAVCLRKAEVSRVTHGSEPLWYSDNDTGIGTRNKDNAGYKPCTQRLS